MDNRIIRYVPVCKREGELRYMVPCQGRHTFETLDKCQNWIDLVWNCDMNQQDTLVMLYGKRADCKPMAVECWPGHFDPKCGIPIAAKGV